MNFYACFSNYKHFFGTFCSIYPGKNLKVFLALQPGVHLLRTMDLSQKNKKIWDGYFQDNQKTEKMTGNLKLQYFPDFLRFFKNFKTFWKIHEKIMAVSIYAFLISVIKVGFILDFIFAFSSFSI